MEEDQIVQAFREHVPDDSSATAVEEHMLDWLDDMYANAMENTGTQSKIRPKGLGKATILTEDKGVLLDNEGPMTPSDTITIKKIYSGFNTEDEDNMVDADNVFGATQPEDDGGVSDISSYGSSKDLGSDDGSFDNDSGNYDSDDDSNKRDESLAAAPERENPKYKDVVFDWPSDDEPEILALMQDSIQDDAEGTFFAHCQGYDGLLLRVAPIYCFL